MKVILASKSPRRKELMDLLHIPYNIIPSNADETLEEGLLPSQQVQRLAYIKAEAVRKQMQGDGIVIGSDTFVVKNNKIYGKPKNKEEAIQMLEELQDSTHEIMTGLCMLENKNGETKKYNIYESTKITICKMERQEILDWLDLGKAFDKAGAYAIQDEFAIYITKIEGNYSSALGLPINVVNTKLKEMLNK